MPFWIHGSNCFFRVSRRIRESTRAFPVFFRFRLDYFVPLMVGQVVFSFVLFLEGVWVRE